jgi:peptide/nickel transport system permease protein
MRYALARLVQFVIVIVVVTFAVLAISRIGSKDPARDLAGGAVSQERVEEVSERFHLDEPIVVQYGYWLKDFVTFDMGYSYIQSQDVVAMFKQRMPVTLFVAFWAIFVGLLIAVPAGVYSAYKRDGALDRIISAGSFAVISMPALVLAVLLSYLLSVRWEVFPLLGTYVAPWSSPVEHFKNFFLPAITLGAGLGAVWTRLLRADMIGTLQSDFIMLARAKGMSPSRVLWRHALRGSVLSLLTSVALNVGGLIGGAVVIEQIFSLPGVGLRLVESVQTNDLLTLQAIAAVLAVAVVVANFVVDLLYAAVDPRIRHARALS